MTPPKSMWYVITAATYQVGPNNTQLLTYFRPHLQGPENQSMYFTIGSGSTLYANTSPRSSTHGPSNTKTPQWVANSKGSASLTSPSQSEIFRLPGGPKRFKKLTTQKCFSKIFLEFQGNLASIAFCCFQLVKLYIQKSWVETNDVQYQGGLKLMKD